MPRQIHSAPAAAAVTLILSAAGFAVVTLALLASGPPTASHLTIASAGTQVHNLVREVMTILFLGYLCGIVGWLLVFAAHADGKHKLETLRLATTAAVMS